MPTTPDFSALMGYEPRGGNVYRPHTLMCNSGEFWRCAHGVTGFTRAGEHLVWVGCEACAVADPAAYALWHKGDTT